MFFVIPDRQPGRGRQAGCWKVLVALAAIAAMMPSVRGANAQAVDCGRLQQQIAQGDSGAGGSRYAQAARRQASELARTQAYAKQLGCNRFSFFGGSPECGGLTSRIGQMQANLAQLQAAAGGGGRNDLVARYNAYCRGAQPPSQPRGFFESIFGGSQPPPGPLPQLPPGSGDGMPGDGDELSARGGSQAVCVRGCDGGFFPLGISARHGSESLNEMCQALCPGTEASVYTRNPDSDIKTAVSIEGKRYMDLPNALKYQKSFNPSCSCRTAGKSWAETLANAEEVLGNTRKGDIVVTPEQSEAMSRPKPDAKTRADKTRASLVDAEPTSKALPPPGAALAGDADAPPRVVRQVGPQP